MQKSLKKIFNVFLGLLMTLTMIGVNPTPVYAEGDGSLTGIYSFARYFTQESMNPFTSGGYSVAAVLRDSSGRVIGDLFCIEPGTHTGVGANYTNTYEQTDPGVAGVIYAFHMSMLDDSSSARAKYLGAQLAVWAKIRGIRGAIDGLVPTGDYQADASAAKYWAGVYFDNADAAYAAVNTAWSNPYELSTGNFAFNKNSTAVRFTTTGDNTVYFRSEPIHLDIQGDAGMVAKVLSLVTYTVSLENAPEGTKITDINGNERNTFVPAQSFRVYVPVKASVNHSPMKVNVRINGGYTAWTTEIWHSGTNQDFAVQRAEAAGEKNKSFNISFPTAEAHEVPEKKVYTNALYLMKEAPQITGTQRNGDGTTGLVWENMPKVGAKFKVTNATAFTDTTGRHYDAESYIQYVYSDFHDATTGNIRFSDLPADENAADIKWRVEEVEAPYGYSTATIAGDRDRITVTVKSRKCAAEQIGTASFPECESTDDYIAGSITTVLGEGYRFVNEPVYAEFEFKKVNEKFEGLANAKFNLYNSEDIEMYDGNLIKAGTLLGVLTSGSDGKVSSSQLSFKLPSTVNYYVTEVEAPRDYVREVSSFFIKKGSDGKYRVYDKENTEVTQIINKQPPEFSIVSTTATADGEKTVAPGSEITITDKVVIKVDKVTELDPGMKLSLLASLVDKDEKVIGESSLLDFDPADYPLVDGKIEVETSLNVNTEGLEGRYVVYEVLADEDGIISNHTDWDDDAQAITFVVPENPEIKTSAVFENGEKKIVQDGMQTVVDTVTYTGLNVGETYKLEGYFVNEKGEKVGVEAEKSFQPTEKNGSVDVEFDFDTDDFAGKKLTVYETLYKGEEVIAEHKELNDEKQTIEITPDETKEVAISTYAEFEGNVKEIVAGGQKTLMDTVTYTGLTPGVEYKMVATYYDAATKQQIASLSGLANFTPESSDGEVSVDILINTDDFVGKSIVVAERLFQGELQIAEHDDLADTKQTVTVKERPATPEISTNAVIAGDKKEVVADGTMTLEDVVSYSGLTAGKNYTLKATYLNPETGDAYSLTGSKNFKAEASVGKVSVLVDIDTNKFVGKKIVVFEELYDGETLIAEHKELTDVKQTVSVTEKPVEPKISTTATLPNGKKEVVANGTMTLTDTVSYSGLTVGKEYTLKASYYNPQTKEKYSLEGSKTFTAKTADGSIDVLIDINTDEFAEKSIVVYEELYDGETLIAEHKELTDKKQTVKVTPATPKISTTAMFPDGAKEVEAGSVVKLTDRVDYEGLTLHKEYELKASYYDPNSKEKYPFEGSTKFVAGETKGYINVDVEVDTGKYANRSIVVFEELYEGNKKVASHTDYTDKDQTVKIRTTPVPPVVSIATLAKFDDGSKERTPDGTLTIIDTVSYSGLTEGKSYTLKASLVDSKTKELAAVATHNFSAAAETGSVDMAINVISEKFVGRSLVVFEELYDGEEMIAEHKDINDAGQTVKINKLPETYTLKIRKMLRGAYEGEPKNIGIDLSKDPLTFELSKKGSDEVIRINKDNFVNGYYVVEGLSEGKYTLKEVTGMNSVYKYKGMVYQVGKNDKEVSITLNGSKEVDFSNETTDITEGMIRIEKTDEKTGAALSGVEFALFLNGDKTPVATGITNANGILEFKNLRHGKYVVQETKAKAGYYYSDAKYSIDMTKTVQDTVMKLSLKNSQEGAKIRLVKTDSSVEGQPVKGATYGVFKEGTVEPLETGITDETGTINFTKRFPDGEGVYVKEITAAPGYRLDERKHPITIDGTKQELYIMKVTDAPYRVALHLTKVDSEDEDIKLSGAVYGLYYASDVSRTNAIIKLQTNYNGMIKISGLKRGKYVLVEEKAPEGYVISEQEKEIEVDLTEKDDNAVIEVVAHNTKENKAVKIETTATIGGKKEAAWAEELTITDKVCYTNLEVGKTYTMSASLHKTDGTTFSGLMKSSGVKDFEPKTANGCVDVEIPLKTSEMKQNENYTIVVYESLTMKGKSGVIASHEEKADKNQTVTVLGPTATPTPTPTPSSSPSPSATPAPGRDVKTGVEGNNLMLNSTVLLVGSAILAGLLEKRRRH